MTKAEKGDLLALSTAALHVLRAAGCGLRYDGRPLEARGGLAVFTVLKTVEETTMDTRQTPEAGGCGHPRT